MADKQNSTSISNTLTPGVNPSMPPLAKQYDRTIDQELDYILNASDREFLILLHLLGSFSTKKQLYMYDTLLKRLETT